MMNTRMVTKGVIFGLALVLSGCSAFSTPNTTRAPAVKQPRVPTPPPVAAPQPPARPPQPSTSGAWSPLVQKAQQASTRGDYEQALALLERAQRIDPESSEIYLQMARTHRAKGDVAQARAMAERGMLYCSSRGQCDALRAFIR